MSVVGVVLAIVFGWSYGFLDAIGQPQQHLAARTTEAVQAPTEDLLVLPPELLPSPAYVPPSSAPPVPPPRKPKLDGAEPVNLIGLGPDAVTNLIGTPTEVREEPPATVWVYDRGDCRLEVFFYMDMQSESLRSLAIDVKGNVASEVQKQSCLARVLSQREHRG